MAEHVAAQEGVDVAVDACLAAKGWEVERDEESGGFAVDEGFPVELFFADADSCVESLGLAPTRQRSIPELRLLHGYLVDVYECLMTHGVEMVYTPPSVYSWVEAAQAVEAGSSYPLWHPYTDPGMFELLWDERLEVTNSCPQPFVP